MNSPHGAKTNDSAESSNGLLLSARGIGKSFSGVPALRDGQLSLRPGSVRALCGANWSRAEALSLMENWLTAHPDQIQGVIGQNDEMALGAIEAIRAAKLDVKKFAIAGIDGVTDAMIAAKAGEVVSFLQDAKAQAQGALDLALRAIKGESATVRYLETI